jgi:hypothetical protein
MTFEQASELHMLELVLLLRAYMLEVVLVYVGVQSLIMVYCREQQTHDKNKHLVHT